MKKFTLKLPVTIEEEGATVLPVSTHLEFKIDGPDSCNAEQALQAFVTHISVAAEIAIDRRDLPRS